MRRNFICVLAITLLVGSFGLAQNSGKDAKPNTPKPPDYSGMYNFLRDGEFVQVTVEDGGKVTGFVSRFGDLESDRGEFLDQFFKAGKLDGNKLTFTTETVHGVWFEFAGTIDRGAGKNPGEEAYYVLNGKLTQYSTDANKKVTAKSRDVAFKEFPEHMAPTPAKKD